MASRAAILGRSGGNWGELSFHTQYSENGVLNEVMRINSSGNVGIGTTTPLGLMHLSLSSVQPAMVFSGTRYYDSGTSGQPGVAVLHYYDGTAKQTNLVCRR